MSNKMKLGLFGVASIALWILNTKVAYATPATSMNINNTNYSLTGDLIDPSVDPKWSYSHAENTLTLDGIQSAHPLSFDGDITIKLKKSNLLTEYIKTTGNLTITSPADERGKLLIEFSNNFSTESIISATNELVIKGVAKVVTERPFIINLPADSRPKDLKYVKAKKIIVSEYGSLGSSSLAKDVPGNYRAAIHADTDIIVADYGLIYAYDAHRNVNGVNKNQAGISVGGNLILRDYGALMTMYMDNPFRFINSSSHLDMSGSNPSMKARIRQFFSLVDGGHNLDEATLNSDNRTFRIDTNGNPPSNIELLYIFGKHPVTTEYSDKYTVSIGSDNMAYPRALYSVTVRVAEGYEGVSASWTSARSPRGPQDWYKHDDKVFEFSSAWNDYYFYLYENNPVKLNVTVRKKKYQVRFNCPAEGSCSKSSSESTHEFESNLPVTISANPGYVIRRVKERMGIYHNNNFSEQSAADLNQCIGKTTCNINKTISAKDTLFEAEFTEAPRITTSTPDLQQGREVTINLYGMELQNGEDIDVYLNSNPLLLGTTRINANTGSIIVTIPCSFATGNHVVTAHMPSLTPGIPGTLLASLPIRVNSGCLVAHRSGTSGLGAPNTGAKASLPETTKDSLAPTLILVGGLLLSFGLIRLTKDRSN